MVVLIELEEDSRVDIDEENSDDLNWMDFPIPKKTKKEIEAQKFFSGEY